MLIYPFLKGRGRSGHDMEPFNTYSTRLPLVIQVFEGSCTLEAGCFFVSKQSQSRFAQRLHLVS